MPSGAPIIHSEWANKGDDNAHARFTLGNFKIMGSDSPGGRFSKPQGYAVNIDVDTPEEADRIFATLSPGRRDRHADC